MRLKKIGLFILTVYYFYIMFFILWPYLFEVIDYHVHFAIANQEISANSYYVSSKFSKIPFIYRYVSLANFDTHVTEFDMHHLLTTPTVEKNLFFLFCYIHVVIYGIIYVIVRPWLYKHEFFSIRMFYRVTFLLICILLIIQYFITPIVVSNPISYTYFPALAQYHNTINFYTCACLMMAYILYVLYKLYRTCLTPFRDTAIVWICLSVFFSFPCIISYLFFLFFLGIQFLAFLFS